MVDYDPMWRERARCVDVRDVQTWSGKFSPRQCMSLTMSSLTRVALRVDAQPSKRSAGASPNRFTSVYAAGRIQYAITAGCRYRGCNAYHERDEVEFFLLNEESMAMKEFTDALGTRWLVWA